MRSILANLHRSLSKIEPRHLAPGSVQIFDVNDLDPEVLAIWLSVGIDQMTPQQLELLDDNLNRLTM